MYFVSDGFFLAGADKDAKLDGLAVGLDEVVGLLKNVPIYPAIEMFDDSEGTSQCGASLTLQLLQV